MKLIINWWILSGVVVCCVIHMVGGFRATLRSLILVSCDMFHAEMWGMYDIMKLARRRLVTHLLVESDNKLLINMGTWDATLVGLPPFLSVHMD
jgi:hypothetical protein